MDLPLISTEETRLCREYFDEYFCAYARNGFKTQDEMSLEALPRGTYEASVRLSSPDGKIDRRTRLIARKMIGTRQPMGDSELLVKGGKSGIKIIKRCIIGTETNGVRFSLKKSWRRDRRVHAEGVLFLPGRNADKRNHSMYYLILQGRRGCFSFPLEVRKNPKAVRPHVGSGDVGSCPSGYFSTPGEAGIDVSGVPADRYRMLISMSTGGALFTEKTGGILPGKTR